MSFAWFSASVRVGMSVSRLTHHPRAILATTRRSLLIKLISELFFEPATERRRLEGLLEWEKTLRELATYPKSALHDVIFFSVNRQPGQDLRLIKCPTSDAYSDSR